MTKSIANVAKGLLVSFALSLGIAVGWAASRAAGSRPDPMLVLAGSAFPMRDALARAPAVQTDFRELLLGRLENAPPARQRNPFSAPSRMAGVDSNRFRDRFRNVYDGARRGSNASARPARPSAGLAPLKSGLPSAGSTPGTVPFLRSFETGGESPRSRRSSGALGDARPLRGEAAGKGPVSSTAINEAHSLAVPFAARTPASEPAGASEQGAPAGFMQAASGQGSFVGPRDEELSAWQEKALSQASFRTAESGAAEAAPPAGCEPTRAEDPYCTMGDCYDVFGIPNWACKLGSMANYANGYAFAGWSPQNHSNGGADDAKYLAYNYLVAMKIDPRRKDWAPQAAADLDELFPAASFTAFDGETLRFSGDNFIHGTETGNGEFRWLIVE